MSAGLIGVDMDGTLLTPDLRISGEDADALRKAVNFGFSVVIMTGRCPGDAAAFLHEADLDLQIAALSGTCMLSGGELSLETYFMDRDDVRRILSVLDDAGVEYTVFGESLSACDREGRSANYWITHHDWSPCAIGRKEIERVQEAGVCKIACLLPEVDPGPVRQEIIRRCSALLSVEITTSGSGNMEFTSVVRNKGIAIRMLADQLGIEKDRIFVIGDSDNDLSMMEQAGYVCCMKNGSDNAKRLADIVVPGNSENGVASAVNTILSMYEKENGYV